MMKLLVGAAERLKQTSEINIAAMRGSEDLQKLLSSDSCNDINQAGQFDERYPLMWACCFRRLKSVKLLIAHGALVNGVEGDQGRNCLHFACDNNDADMEIIEVLLDHGADLGQKDWKDRRPIEMESLPEDIKATMLKKTTLYAALRYRMDTIVIPVTAGYDTVQGRMRANLGCIPTLWVDLPAVPELQIKNENFKEVIEAKKAAAETAELVLYIESARLSRERRDLANSTNPEEKAALRGSSGFQRLCKLCHNDNLNTKREARRNLANLIGDAEANAIAKIQAPTWTEAGVQVPRPAPGKGYKLEKLLEAAEIAVVERKASEKAWHDHMAKRISAKIDLQNLMFDFQQQFDKIESEVEHFTDRNTKLQRKLDIKKKELAQAEKMLADKKDKLQVLHEETAVDSDAQRKSMGSFDMGSFDGRRASTNSMGDEGRGSVAQRASFRASVEGLRASLAQERSSMQERQSMRGGSIKSEEGLTDIEKRDVRKSEAQARKSQALAEARKSIQGSMAG